MKISHITGVEKKEPHPRFCSFLNFADSDFLLVHDSRVKFPSKNVTDQMLYVHQDFTVYVRAECLTKQTKIEWYRPAVEIMVGNLMVWK